MCVFYTKPFAEFDLATTFQCELSSSVPTRFYDQREFLFLLNTFPIMYMFSIMRKKNKSIRAKAQVIMHQECT
jgi:hypothetical protein